MKKNELNIGTIYELKGVINGQNLNIPNDQDFEEGTNLQFLGFDGDSCIVKERTFEIDEYEVNNLWAVNTREFLKVAASEVEFDWE